MCSSSLTTTEYSISVMLTCSCSQSIKGEVKDHHKTICDKQYNMQANRVKTEENKWEEIWSAAQQLPVLPVAEPAPRILEGDAQFLYSSDDEFYEAEGVKAGQKVIEGLWGGQGDEGIKLRMNEDVVPNWEEGAASAHEAVHDVARLKEVQYWRETIHGTGAFPISESQFCNYSQESPFNEVAYLCSRRCENSTSCPFTVHQEWRMEHCYNTARKVISCPNHPWLLMSSCRSCAHLRCRLRANLLGTRSRPVSLPFPLTTAVVASVL